MPTAHLSLERPARAPTPRQRDRLRAAWFQQIGAADPRVASLGLDPEDVLDHMAAAPMRRDPARVQFDRLALADAAVAVGCVRGLHAAWMMLGEHAPLLQRALAGVMESDEHPFVTARRFLDGVRDATAGDSDSAVNLRRYAGERPLRVWLVDRALGVLSGDLRRLRPATLQAPQSRRLRLAFEIIEDKRRLVRAAAGAEPASRVERLVADRNS